MKSKRTIRSALKVTTALSLVLAVSACSGLARYEAKPRPAFDLEKQADRAAMLFSYCDKLYDSGDLYMAASICQRAFDTKPTDPAPLYTLAEIYKLLDAPEQAANAYRAAIMINPDDFEAIYGLAKTSIDMGNYEVAEAQLERALQINDNDPRVYSAMGVVKDKKGEHRVAQALYRTGLLIDPDNVSLRNNLGLSLTLSGDQAESIAMLREVAREPKAGSVGSQNLAHAATYNAPPEVMAARDTADGPIEIRPEGEDGLGKDFTEGDGLASAMSKPLHKQGATVKGEPGMGPTDVTPGSRSIGSRAVKASPGQQEIAARIAPAPPKYEKEPAKPKKRMTAAMPSSGGPYQVQVGAYTSEKHADRAWKTVLTSAKGLLDGLSREVVKADLGDTKGVVYRLRAGPLPNRAASKKLCGELSGRGVGCFVVALPKAADKPASKPAAMPAAEMETKQAAEPAAEVEQTGKPATEKPATEKSEG